MPNCITSENYSINLKSHVSFQVALKEIV